MEIFYELLGLLNEKRKLGYLSEHAYLSYNCAGDYIKRLVRVGYVDECQNNGSDLRGNGKFYMNTETGKQLYLDLDRMFNSVLKELLQK